MLLPVAALLVAMVSIQFGASFAKTLITGVGAPGTTALRLALSALILILAFRPWRRPIPRPVRLPLIGYGAVLGCMNLRFYCSLRTVPLGIAVALEFLGPLALTVHALRRPTDAGWLALAVLGLLTLLPLHASIHAIDPIGALFALGAGACWALYIMFGRRIGATLGTQATALGTLIAAACVAPIGVLHAGAALLQPPILLRGLVVAIFSSAIPYTLEMVALTRLSHRVFGTLTSLEPAVGAVMGMLLLHQRLTPLQWCAIAAIVAAAIGTARPE
jgi:inner membrane transporter RhtA